MRTISRIWTLALLIGAAATAAWAQPEDARFSGGSFDGWDRFAMTESQGLGGALVTLSSGTNQIFDFTATPSLAELTIYVEDPMGVITNGGAMRVTVPSDWACVFDTGASVSISGNASGKTGAASYTDGGRALRIPLTADFIAGDTLVISGLLLAELRLVPPDTKNLELDVNDDGSRDVYDNYTLQVRARWPGGSFDGWDRDVMAESGDLMIGFKGLFFKLVEQLIEPEKDPA